MKYRILYTEISSKGEYGYAKEHIINYINKQGTLVQASLLKRSNHLWKKDMFGVVEFDKGNYSYHVETHKKIRRIEVVLSSTEDEDLEKRVEDLKFATNLKEINS